MKIKSTYSKYVILINEDLRSKHEIPATNEKELNPVNYDSASKGRSSTKKKQIFKNKN